MEIDIGRREMNLHNKISDVYDLIRELELKEIDYGYIDGFSKGTDGLITILYVNIASLEAELKGLRDNA